MLKYSLPSESQPTISSSASEQFEDWEKPSRQNKIFATSLLTAMLYIVFSLVEKSWAPDQAQILMNKAHFLIVVPILLVISYLAYKRRFYDFMMIALALAPIISILCHAYIVSKLSVYAPYQMEGYMVIFWTFIISGLTVKYALYSAVCSSFILLISAYYLMGGTDFYTMHVFWVGCSFSFGLLGALIYEKSRKVIFANHKELHRLAITDSLTGIFNRNQLNNVLNESIKRSLHKGQSFGLLILDVDHFKNVNDTFGHDEGDRVLKQIAQLLSTLICEGDTLIRWGGEEFVVVTHVVNEKELFVLSEKFRKQIEKEKYGANGNMTVSIGSTLFNKNDTQDTLVSRADKALYAAKEKGRNNSVYLK